MIKLKIFGGKDYPGLFSRPNVITRVLIKRDRRIRVKRHMIHVIHGHRDQGVMARSQEIRAASRS